MTVARPNRMSPVAAATSALVVGIESYRIAGAGADLPGSAKLAARFARWLLRQGICLPERITLMTAYDEAAYSSGKYGPELSPEDDLEELRAGPGVKVDWLPHANAASDFGEWINGTHAPREKDAFFLLFWVGHGFTYPGLRDRRLCLLGSDANDYQLNHVELTDLLDVVSEIAPGVHEVAFVNTCRAPVTAGWERRLQDGWRPVTPPTSQPLSSGGSQPASEQSIVYAAAHGQTTKMAGWQDRTFADVLLEKLDALPDGAGPLAVFDDDLKGFGDLIGWRPYVTTFGYFHDRTERLDTPPQDDRDLTYDEWQRLVKIARRIDAGPKTRWDVRLGAYCQAVGLEEVLGLDTGHVADRPRSPDTLEDLIGVLRNRPLHRGPSRRRSSSPANSWPTCPRQTPGRNWPDGVRPGRRPAVPMAVVGWPTRRAVAQAGCPAITSAYWSTKCMTQGDRSPPVTRRPRDGTGSARCSGRWTARSPSGETAGAPGAWPPRPPSGSPRMRSPTRPRV